MISLLTQLSRYRVVTTVETHTQTHKHTHTHTHTHTDTHTHTHTQDTHTQDTHNHNASIKNGPPQMTIMHELVMTPLYDYRCTTEIVKITDGPRQKSRLK